MKRNARFQILCPYCSEGRTYKEIAPPGVEIGPIEGMVFLCGEDQEGFPEEADASLIRFPVSVL